MPPQREMFEPPKLSLTLPAGQEGPRLWVRRLAIWEAPGGQKIRDIELRPGLNVVWSPDGFDETNAGGVRAIGHGSGKTLFCRLLRYCLGEQRFASSSKNILATRLPNGDLAIALWNLSDPGQPSHGSKVELTLRNVPANAGVAIQRVDDEHGNVLPRYAIMGKPLDPTDDQVEQLNRETALGPPEVLSLKAGQLTLTLERNALVLLMVQAR